MSRSVGRCDALVRKGTGTGACGHPLDGHGFCDQAGDHIEETWPEVRNEAISQMLAGTIEKLNDLDEARELARKLYVDLRQVHGDLSEWDPKSYPGLPDWIKDEFDPQS